ncbi:MAG: zf-HC2 domain-containing protein [Acidobacteriia bacterium]|nr:zf-HC2 domain-containing protein [Terriglobia bacterium]
MTMNCNHFEDLWIDYLDETLDGATRRQVEEHLSHCEKCAALAAEMRGNRFLASAIPEVEPPPRLIYKIIADTTGTAAAPAWYDFIFDFIRPQQLPKLAMGSLMAVASLAVVLYAMGLDFRHITTAELRPSRLWEHTNREVHLAYSRGVKYYNALRIVYEIQSRVQSLNASTSDQDQPNPVEPQEKTAPAPPAKSGSQRTVSEEHAAGVILVQNFHRSENPGGLS